jgi:hypothetical protein
MMCLKWPAPFNSIKSVPSCQNGKSYLIKQNSEMYKWRNERNQSFSTAKEKMISWLFTPNSSSLSKKFSYFRQKCLDEDEERHQMAFTYEIDRAPGRRTQTRRSRVTFGGDDVSLGLR